MDTLFKIYYLGLALACILALWIFYIPKPHSYGVGHTMAVNVTKINDTFCKLYWLGGTDYDSFVDDIKVGNESVGHPLPGSVIYEGPDCNTTVGMYFRDVRAYQTIHPKHLS